MKKKETTLSEIQISYKPRIASHPTVKSSRDIYEYVIKFYPKETIALQEQFSVVYLNRANKILGVAVISKGGISGTIADIRIIMSLALKTLCSGIVLVHNHPSGNVAASLADIEITKKVESACKFLDIKLLDHIILSPESKYLSFTDEHLL